MNRDPDGDPPASPWMPRTPQVDQAALDGAAAELYARYASGARADEGVDFRLIDEDGQLTGPPAAWMLAPELGLAYERVGYEVRFGLTLTPRQREIVILLVAAAEDSGFERFAHRQAASRAGLDHEEIESLDTGRFSPVGDDEATVVDVAYALLEEATLDDAAWTRAEAILGARRIFEIVTLVGWYRLMAMQLRIFRLEPPRSTSRRR